MANYAFIPAYYEWHFIDTENPENVLLSWQDPVESLYKGEDSDVLMTDIDDVYSECEDFINITRMNLELDDERKDVNGNTIDNLNDLPANTVDIMAQALYDYYIA